MTQTNRPRRTRSPLSRVITPAQAQLGWYARNAFESEAQDDLLRQIRNVTTRLPQAALRDADALDNEFGLPLLSNAKDDPLPAPGTKLHARLRKRIELMLSRYKEPEAGTLPFEINASYAAAAFGLSQLEKQFLQLALRARRSASLRDFIGQSCLALDEVPRTVAAVLGVPAQAIEGCLRPNERLLRCGLLQYEPGRVGIFNHFGGLFMPESMWVTMSTSFQDEHAWTQAIIGRPVASTLAWEDFAHLGDGADMAWRLLNGAVEAGTPGVHIMLAGPPGTGKSEFAAALAAKAAISLYAVGETDDNRGEPSRGERLSALQASQAMLHGQSRVAILLDEAEDVLESRHTHGDRKDAISKAYVNRMLETSSIPTIWTSNALDTMDLATVRRMSLIIRVTVPDAPGREIIWRRVLQHEQLALDADAAGRLAKKWAAPAAAAAMAARTTRLAKGAEAELQVALGGIMSVLGRDEAFMDAAPESRSAFDPELTACSQDLEALSTLLTRDGAPKD